MRPTDCDFCQWEEATPRQRLRMRLEAITERCRCWGFGAGRDPFSVAARSWSTVMLAAIGSARSAGDSWYDRHRAAYVATGDPAELTRMLRHV